MAGLSQGDAGVAAGAVPAGERGRDVCPGSSSHRGARAGHAGVCGAPSPSARAGASHRISPQTPGPRAGRSAPRCRCREQHEQRQGLKPRFPFAAGARPAGLPTCDLAAGTWLRPRPLGWKRRRPGPGRSHSPEHGRLKQQPLCLSPEAGRQGRGASMLGAWFPHRSACPHQRGLGDGERERSGVSSPKGARPITGPRL